jgi:transposase
MGFREVSVVEVFEVLRWWLEGLGLRTIGQRAGLDRKTVRRYVAAAQAAGLSREAGVEALTDALVGQVLEAVRPVRPNGHGPSWQLLLEHEEQIRAWIKGEGERRPLTIAKVHNLLTRQGVVVPYRTLHRFAVARCGFRPSRTTVPVADGEPGVECQVDFALMGYLHDPESGRRRKVHALIFTAVVSRHMFVWLTHTQSLSSIVAGCQAAWVFFGGCFKVLIPDNVKAIVTDAEAVNPRLSVGWLDYAQHVGFGTDPTRVASPQDKPRVERVVQYVRGNFWDGEDFADLADAQARAEAWCREVAGARIHGTTAARPLQLFTAVEAGVLLPVPAVYDEPVFTVVKVHRDFHVEVAKALYSVPQHYLGARLQARADSELVKLYTTGPGGGQLVKVHPRQPPGRRSTDAGDLPEHKATYALRDLARLIGDCAVHGENIGIYAERLLDDPLPWTRMRAVYRLLGLVRKYGPEPVEAACSTALDLDVVSVTKIAAMLAKATETTPPTLPAAAGITGGRFARDNAEYLKHRHTSPAASSSTPAMQLALVPGDIPDHDDRSQTR